MSQSQSYALIVQSIDELSWTSSGYSKFRATFKPNLFVKVFVDDVPVGQTKVIKGSLKPVWRDKLTIPSATESSIIVLKLNHSSSLTGDSCLGIVRTSIDDLLRLCGESDMVRLGLRQSPNKAKHDAQGLISVGIKAMNADQARGNLLKNAQQDIERGHLQHADSTRTVQRGPENLGAAAPENKDLLQSFGTALERIQAIANATVNVVDVIARVHPYADTAWKVLSSVYKAYQHQKETDANVVALFDKMAALYSFVEDLEEGLPSKIERLEGTIVRVLEKTTECGMFFREYTERRSTSRLLGQMTSDQKQMVSDLSSSLEQLQGELNSGVMLQTAFDSSKTRKVIVQTAFESSQTREVVVQTRAVVEKFVGSDGLKRLDPANMDSAIRSSCLAGTRENLLRDIINRLINASEGKNVLWLHGAAGLGKSTLANSIAEHFGGRRQLGAFLFFDRNTPLESTPGRVIRTLAYQLAEHNQAIKNVILLAMESDPQLTSAPLSTQFTSLLMKPLSAASQEITGPVIIVLDALDECGGTESRRALLALLFHELAKFPRQFRFLITSRPDPDIVREFNSTGHSHMHTIDLSTSESSADVLLFIEHEMGQIYSRRHSYDELPPDWPGLVVVQQLAAFAAGLFIWAATAMKFLRQTDDLVECLSNLLAHDREVFTLDELYKTALLSASGWKPGKVNTVFRQVLGLIVIGQIPLTDATINEVLGFEDSGKQCRIALRRLSCVIQWSEGKPARTFHKSFSEYLTDRSRCSSEPWFIDVEEHHRALTIHSFRVMKSQLRFNICNLTNSHILNKDVMGLRTRVQSSIPDSLSYVCRFWMDHLRQAPTGDSDILSLIHEFFEHRFLYWLEVLSLLEDVSNAAMALNRVKSYAMDTKSELHAFAQDGLSFVRTFASIITESIPHIYLSCLPFTPSSSIIRQRYSKVVPKTLVVQTGLQDKWPPCQQVIAVNDGLVLSAACSPDGQRVASGSSHGKISIWDAESGALKVGPFAEHADCVRSVVFSQDGQCVASGSDDRTICIWDAESGVLKAGPFTGHQGYVWSVAFSPDGQRVASGSADNTICIWDAESGALKVGPLRGHTDDVNSVSFSPDGQCVVSGSDDKTIRIWDAESGALKAGPFTGHTKSVLSVVFSSDGQRIASGSEDNTICIWDAESGVLEMGPLMGHTGAVNSVTISPDGQRVASGSNDKTVRLWDAESGSLQGGSLTGHTSSVRSVAFSPDGQRVASGSSDGTIRIWDVESSVFQGESFTGHTKSIQSVVFSLDGNGVASGSADNTICIWDAASGALKVGPLKEHTDWINSVAISPDGQHVASGSADKTVRIWDVKSGALQMRPFTGHTGSVRSVVFSPDGKGVASGSEDKTICIWDAESGALKAGPLKRHMRTVFSVAFSSDGQRVASGSADATIRIWDVKSGALKAGPFGEHTDFVRSVVFSPDGQCVASGSDDNTICIWDVESGVLKAGPFTGHTDYVLSVAFSMNGQLVASGSTDRTIRIWDAASGALKAGPFRGHTDKINSVAFSPDGQHIVSASNDRTIRIYDLTLSTVPAEGYASDGFQYDSQLDENGWMRNNSSSALFWVPHVYRTGLWRPNNTAVIAEHSMRLDMAGFVHGEDWAQCHM